MATQRYSVTPHPIETLLTWVKSGEIAIPEIQRPFVWDATKVRNLLDSLYNGYPVGYLIAWRNPTVRLKDGTTSSGKRILIDGQQRVTALMAALLGQEVVDKDYRTRRIRIAFNPLEQKFEVTNPAIQKDSTWIADIADVFSPEIGLIGVMDDYLARNPEADRKEISGILQRLWQITNNHVGVIELAEDLDIETVTEIFIRVNSAGAQLSQADFVMSKIAADERNGGNQLRKAIDYFCHLAVAPEAMPRIEKNDTEFVKSEYFQKMRWLSNVNDDLYDPSYTDMLRVAFTSEFGRGKLQDLVALLSGRNFETRDYEEEIAEASFERLKKGVFNFMSKTHFDRLTMILRSAGFVTSNLIRSKNAVNFAYIIYLRGRAENMDAASLERLVRRWYVMSVLRGRYSGNAESSFDYDIRQIEMNGLAKYANAVIQSELSEDYWSALLPQQFNSSASTTPSFVVFKAAQAKLGDLGFLSRDITVRDLLLNRSDVHHVFPKNYLKGRGFTAARYNQVANFVIAQSEINIAIGDKAPDVYFSELADQCSGGPQRYGGITDIDELQANLQTNCVPSSVLNGPIPEYDDFLEERRKMMAGKIHLFFKSL
ncbi:GmrSD restriction endonuclease domain-containing protein [Thalassovita sp.]|uniref:GmrSD restriction endonuclease domain-containing protein n=1 Tax=Thalassovita sp. TaxID=1979401 RepID=UPI003B5B3460